MTTNAEIPGMTITSNGNMTLLYSETQYVMTTHDSISVNNIYTVSSRLIGTQLGNKGNNDLNMPLLLFWLLTRL